MQEDNNEGDNFSLFGNNLGNFMNRPSQGMYEDEDEDIWADS